MDNIEKFISRLKLIDIEVELLANYPWIYLISINGTIVSEKNASEHFFTIGYSKNNVYHKCGFEYLSKTFKLIRKYSQSPKEYRDGNGY